jgi:prepilin-type N-terminal cleavage/methylation domain-containing protein
MKKGFTLIELMVSVAVFSLALTAALGIFVSSLKVQRYALSSQQISSQSSYIMEYMSRAARMARKDVDAICISYWDSGELIKLNYKKTRDGQGIKFLNYQDQCQEFFLEGTRLKENKNGVENYLTGSDLEVLSFKVGPDSSWDQEDDEQPRVVLFLEIQGKGQGSGQRPNLKLQTAVSQRNIDIRK